MRAGTHRNGGAVRGFSHACCTWVFWRELRTVLPLAYSVPPCPCLTGLNGPD